MSNFYQMYTLAELSQIIKRGISPKYSDKKGIPVINQRCIRDGRIFWENTRLHDLSKKKIPRDRFLEIGDVLVNSTGVGTLGRVSNVDELPTQTTVDSHVTIVRPDKKKVHYPFFGYAVKFKQRLIESLGHGSTGQTELSRKILGEVEIPLPPLAIQERIADILGTLDDKIELNRKMNHTLEAMARAIFKSWFVDFDLVYAKMEGRYYPLPAEVIDLFPDELVESELGVIPKGWEIQHLNDVCLVIDCLHSKKPEKQEAGKLLLQVFNIGDAGRTDFLKKYFINDEDYSKWITRIEVSPGDLIISKTGRVGAIAQIPFGLKAALGRNLVGIRVARDILTQEYLRDYFLSSWMRVEKAMNTSQGTILQSLHVKSISKFRILIPSKQVIEQYTAIVSSIHQKMESNDKEIETHSELRDTLLPKLMSGEIKV